jgi:Kef-type K+ transport system membrane component KefB
VTGIIVPREGGLKIALTEKLEDMVSIIFLPLVRLFSIFLIAQANAVRAQYFTLSGLSTNLGLLDDGKPTICTSWRSLYSLTGEGITWGYTIAIICCAFAGKFGGCALAARYIAGFNWRESGAIGSLMSCKG